MASPERRAAESKTKGGGGNPAVPMSFAWLCEVTVLNICGVELIVPLQLTEGQLPVSFWLIFIGVKAKKMGMSIMAAIIKTIGVFLGIV
jgi:hypothetical protein